MAFNSRFVWNLEYLPGALYIVLFCDALADLAALVMLLIKKDPGDRSIMLISLIFTLVFYAAGDIAVLFSVPGGGVLYGAGHVFLLWMKHARYDRKHRYSGGVRSYYSEKYGELRIFPCLFCPDGTAVLTTESGRQLELDEGFFENITVLGKTIPCIAPGGQELIKELL